MPNTGKTLFLLLAILFSFGDLVLVDSVALPRLAKNKGAWIGPGTALGTESRQVGDNIIPCSVVWVVINDRLWRCAPEQIRRASEREHSEHILQQVRPWTFENISKNLILGQYRNVAEEPHPEAPDLDMEDPEMRASPLLT